MINYGDLDVGRVELHTNIYKQQIGGMIFFYVSACASRWALKGRNTYLCLLSLEVQTKVKKSQHSVK